MPSKSKSTLVAHFPGPGIPLDWEAFTQSLLNATRDGVAAVNRQGTVVFANQVAQLALGLRAGCLLEELQPDLWPKVAETLREPKHQLGIHVSSNYGSYLAKVSPMVWNSTLIGALCIYEDSSELEELTRRMISFQNLSRELDAIIDSSSDGLWIADHEGKVIRINPASERINNIRAEQVVGRNMHELVSEGFVNRSATIEVIKTKAVVNMLQQTREGRKLIVTGNPIFDEGGNVTRVVVNERDITEIDRLHSELEEREARSDQFRQQMLEMQLAEVESRKIVFRSPSMLKAMRQALKVSGAESSVLILGESGVGKGMIADLIHKYSRRCEHPMIKINCGAIPESLVESELFGYEKGAFTGALKSGKPGYFELADGGILFLDEIAELPLTSQVKLLRFLEDALVMRLGSTVSRKLDVRIIAATNRDLEVMVEQRQFRRDLYYRLNVIPIHIPPLRERREDILPLIRHYLDHFGNKLGVEKPISRAALNALLSHTYAGNVRELMNICERLVVMSEGKRIDLADLPGSILEKDREGFSLEGRLMEGRTWKEMTDAFEQAVLKRAAEQFGNQESMASALGVDQSTIARKLKKHGIRSGGSRRNAKMHN